MPEPERIQLPLRPAGGSLASHIAALDLLASRLDSLPTRSRWPVRVPLNSKGSFNGNAVHTNEVKVYIGGDEWAEMTASEGAEYIRGRKAALLEDQARVTEGQKPVSLKPQLNKDAQNVMKTKDIKFDPLLAHPGPLPKFIPHRVQESNTLAKSAQLIQSDDISESLSSLVDLVGEHLKDKLTIPEGHEDSEINDEGLPIHEIREDLDGSTLGPMPEPSGDGAVTIDDDADYWAPEAVARRLALRKRLFHEGEDSDEDDDMDVDDESADPEAKLPTAMDVDPAPAVGPDTPASASALAAPPTPPTAESSTDLQRSPVMPPKSILKVPQRKKSVTFDAGTKLPPDSPPVFASKMRGFPIPVAEVDPESPVKSVPIIPAPTPGKGFGGLRPGFLGPAASSQPAPTPTAKIVELNDDEPQEEPKKTSLFAQRRAEQQPSLPKLSKSKQMSTMKTSVVEKPTVTAPSRAPGSSTGLPPTVGSVPTTASASTPLVVVDDDSDPDDYGDLGEFSDDEEDEYALDEALLAREVALEYHRRQAWQKPIDEDDVDPETQSAVMGIPRVSSVTGGTEDDPLRIVNPTPDDLSQFLRVGRDADGKLVFEQPMVDSGSDSEGEGEETQDKQDRRARREETMRRLMTGDYEDLPSEKDAEAERKDREQKWAQSVPPTVQATSTPASNPPPLPLAPVVSESHPPPSVPAKHGRTERDEVARVDLPGTPADDTPAPPKKVSRFKAARQGL